MSTRVGEIPEWGAWVPLKGAGSNRDLPVRAGLYRLRMDDGTGPVYIGQTGSSLRGRLGMLQGAYANEMPYAAPHTAGPALWALRDRDGCDFECSVAPLAADRTMRLGLECLAISIHRIEHGASPLINFGGMPDGYRKSSDNNARLAASGKRFRGGADAAAKATPSHAPWALLAGIPDSLDLLGLEWSEWTAIESVTGLPGRGLYRIRGSKSRLPVYVGQGEIGSRLRAHAKKGSVDGHRQQESLMGPLQASVVRLPGWASRNLLEVENDLIASFVFTQGRPPEAQFLG
jgi:hypothetical protein